jgi:hypothetical protein
MRNALQLCMSNKVKKEKQLAELETDLAHAGNPLGASEVALGVVSGAVIGAMAGLPGAVAGAVIGGAAGVVGAIASGRDAAKHEADDAELDETIGVSSGEMGAPNLKHPPPTSGAYSASSAGVATGGSGTPAEGPTPPPED